MSFLFWFFFLSLTSITTHSKRHTQTEGMRHNKIIIIIPFNCLWISEINQQWKGEREREWHRYKLVKMRKRKWDKENEISNFHLPNRKRISDFNRHSISSALFVLRSRFVEMLNMRTRLIVGVSRKYLLEIVTFQRFLVFFFLSKTWNKLARKYPNGVHFTFWTSLISVWSMERVCVTAIQVNRMRVF